MPKFDQAASRTPANPRSVLLNRPSISVPRVNILNPLEQPDWDLRLDSYPDATIFHTSAWLRAIHDCYRFSPCYVSDSVRTGTPALQPLVEIDSWLTGRRGAGLPFTDECRPLCADAGDFARLFETALSHARARRWQTIEVRGGTDILRAAKPSIRFVGHRLDLRQPRPAGGGTPRRPGPSGSGDAVHAPVSVCASEAPEYSAEAVDPPPSGSHAPPDAYEGLYRRFDGATRRAIRKAENSGLSVEIATDRQAVRDFYRLMCRTRRRHGLPPAPLRFFEAIQSRVLETGHGMVVLARHRGAAVAGAVFLHFGARAVYKYGASDFRHQHLRGNNIVIAHAVRHYARNGFTSLDFGRTSLHNEGLRRFKLAWGTAEYPIEYLKYDVLRREFVADSDRVTGWHTRFFRSMPLLAARFLGTALYKHAA